MELNLIYQNQYYVKKNLIWLWEKRGENINGLAKKWRGGENDIVIWRAQSFQQERNYSHLNKALQAGMKGGK